MNMRKIQYILSGITLITLPLGVHAQQQAKDSTVNRTVVVEQEYTPDIPDASKINVLPQVEAPTANKKAVEYDVTLVPSNTSLRIDNYFIGHAGKIIHPLCILVCISNDEFAAFFEIQ